MRKTFLPAIAAVALLCGAGTLAAQTMSTTMTAEQTAVYGNWSAENRTMYDSWPAEYQTYFWTLSPTQQSAWWMIKADDRTRLYTMTPEQRATAWSSIEAQMAGMANTSASATASTNVATTPGADNSAVTRTYVNNTVAPPPADLMNKTYPVCTSKMQDSCQNPGEGGARGRKRSM